MASRAPSISHLSIDLIGIGDLLSQNFLIVPRNQRSYAWNSSHVLDFFQDITGAYERGEPEYFLGTVVMSEAKSSFEVVDGQQRLATATVWLAAIRDYVAATDAELAQDLENEYLLKRDLRTREVLPKLRLNSKDHDFFLKIVLNRPDSPERHVSPTRDSHDRILGARDVARKHVQNVAENTADPIQSLIDRLDYLAKSARVIYVRVPNHSNAYVIFETLNDRGLELSTADLLKNYLFGLSDDRLEEVEGYWNEMLGVLDLVGKEQLTLTYLRHLWSSIYGPTRDKQLYEAIRKKINNKQRAIDFAAHLASSAKLYAGLVSPSHQVWNQFGDTARQFAETLTYLRLEQFRPLLLAVLEKFKKSEVAKVLRLLVSCSVRFLIVGGLGGGTMERVYCEAAIKVREGDIKTAKQLRAELSKNVPRDSEFESAFKAARVSQAFLARYYLAAIERHLKGKEQPEYVPNPNADELNLEHVLPQNPSADWGDIDEEEAHALYKRVGNLTLLAQKVNTESANAGFEGKKPNLLKSELKLNSYFQKVKKWDASEIEERQGELASLAPKVWPL
ncbi:DUF262 domain-containing protein [Lentisalinibacter sediminis]|uniref:DUF262 domain-containing protein n=1 Tax=Lentisalinibacter sediminis TaxID=2992237 RepID=UPI00386C7860